MTFYHVKTQEDYDALMYELDVKGYRWSEKEPLNSFNAFNTLKGKTVINTHESILKVFFWDIERVKKQVVEYKAKGENMLNTECKQCHKKWHHDNAKYCSMCGKKLVDEPEFKVGDYISTTTNRYTGIVEQIKEQDGVIVSIAGKLYDRYDGYVRETQLWGIDFRKSTPEEIAEYKAALNFNKHGRKPFEIRKGDVILEDDGYKLFIDNPNIWDKGDFTRGKSVLLKTAEEVNEWLGVADE